jgi:steroid delta-isomerase-like uncharacterized protein
MPNDSSTMSANKEIVRRYMDDCWNLGKLDELRELVSDNCAHHDSVFPSLQPGADSLKSHISTCRNGFPDLKFTLDDTIAERNEVVIHWTATGTHKGQFLSMPPTNRQATVTGTSIFRVENGKIAESWSDWNLMSMMQQLGVTAPASKAETKTAA